MPRPDGLDLAAIPHRGMGFVHCIVKSHRKLAIERIQHGVD